jgi:hypothetical protein
MEFPHAPPVRSSATALNVLILLVFLHANGYPLGLKPF